MSDDVNLRSDAKANRDRILDVARDALAADPQASLNSIAKTASVGAGTLYRHFPSRESLVLGVYRKEIDTLIALAPSLLAKYPAGEAFRLWCDRFVKSGRMKYGVADIIHAATSDQDAQQIYTPMLAVVRQFIDACEQSGEIPPGNDPDDFLIMLGFLWQVPPTAAGQARVKRLLTMAFRGLGLNHPAITS
jgi:AcrR family transcriptional regulator